MAFWAGLAPPLRERIQETRTDYQAGPSFGTPQETTVPTKLIQLEDGVLEGNLYVTRTKAGATFGIKLTLKSNK